MGCKKKSITTKVVSKNDNTNIVGKNGNGVTDIDGNNYKTVIIGNQEWMAENLKVTRYNDASSIPNVTDTSKWSSNTTGAWCYNNNDTFNNTVYGKLYNWYTVNLSSNGNKNLCPTGWRLPTSIEWNILTDYLGGDTIAGGKMKEVGFQRWNSPNIDATNSSLFNGLPGGIFSRFNSIFIPIGLAGGWWSNSEFDTSNAWIRGINCSSGIVYNEYTSKKNGVSVRCLRD